ncbi:MAG: YqaJ viral recombinase family protein [Chitinophagaceae bacterium]|nr:YqaJ viral recombinase family protein [Nitrosomonas sp.]MCW5929916.1 YqaJ viral recombinase family protein [Chitinophagaceae bacterium]
MNRQGYIGGSDAAAILGISPWKSPYQLYMEKVGEWQEEIDEKRERIFARGRRLEPIVVEMLVDELKSDGHDVEIIERNKRYLDPELDYLRSEIDVELVINGEEINGEIKTVTPFAAKEWGEQGTDEIPLHYTAQVLHGLMIKPRNRAIVAALIGADDLRVHFVDRDQDAIDMIRKKEIEFWNRIVNREPPDPVTPVDIKYLYRKDQGLIMDADDELASLCAELRGHKQTAKALEELIDELVTKIKLKMGDASVLMYQGKKIATWASNKDGQTTDWKSLAMSLNPSAELINQFTKAKQGARPFLIKG